MRERKVEKLIANNNAGDRRKRNQREMNINKSEKMMG